MPASCSKAFLPPVATPASRSASGSTSPKRRNCPGSNPARGGRAREETGISETGVSVPPADFLEALAPAYAHWEAQLAGFGFAPVRTAWLARAARLGETLTARLPAEEITGIFRDVDENGHLLLTTATGTRRIAAADIFF